MPVLICANCYCFTPLVRLLTQCLKVYVTGTILYCVIYYITVQGGEPCFYGSFSSQPFDPPPSPFSLSVLPSLARSASSPALYALKCERVPVRAVAKPRVWTGTELKSCVLSVFSQTSRMGDPGATQNQPSPPSFTSEASQVERAANTH